MRVTALVLAGAALALAGPADARWVASWTAAPHAPLGTTGPFAAADYNNVTLSQIVRITEGGERLRVRFTNRYGQHPLKIGAARVFRIDDAGNEIPGTSKTLRFGGQDAAVIPVGAPFTSDPVTLAVARLAPFLGMEVVLLRPHGPPTPPPGLDLVSYDARGLAVALGDLTLDDRAAVYSLSHDAEVDHVVALRALRSPAFAVGVLGSRNKIDTRVQRLREAGIGDDELRRLHLPAGLPIGAQTPHGIAVSILAQVSQRDRARMP